jgi:hypothetical protein
MGNDKGYKFVPLTARQLNEYAKNLQRSGNGLSWADALKLANEHEAERAGNYSQLDENLARKRARASDET